MRLLRTPSFVRPAAAMLFALFPTLAAAQERIDTAIMAAIRAEEQARSDVPNLFYTLTDKLGPRLSGSQPTMRPLAGH